MSQIESIDDFIEKSLKNEEKPADAEKIRKIIYGLYPNKITDVPDNIVKVSNELDLDFKLYSFGSAGLTSKSTRKVRVAGIQFKYPADLSKSVNEQLEAVYKKTGQLLEICGKLGTNIVCLQETWPMPFAFCTREKEPWCEFAESAEDGPTFKMISKYANEFGMVIVSPILERDRNTGVIWNTAVVVDENGKFLGKGRKNHIPRVGDFNESTYYMESTLGHPVFETKFGKIAVNICYGRHHPLNWLIYSLNGAEIVFNPSATIDSLSETLWSIEARNAAISNNYFVVAINRVGTEKFPNEFTSGDGEKAHRDLGHFFGSSYIVDPEGSRTPFLSRLRDGIIIGDIDLNKVTTTRDHWGFQMTSRIGMYAEKLNKYTKDNLTFSS